MDPTTRFAAAWNLDSGWVQVGFALAAAAFSGALWCARYWWIGRQGRSELRRIYRHAIKVVLADRHEQRLALGVLNAPEFFDTLVMPNHVSRSTEVREFRTKLQAAWTSTSESRIDTVTRQVFAEILNRLMYAKSPTWQEKYTHWCAEINAAPDSAESAPDTRWPVYLPVVLLNSQAEGQAVVDGACRFFEQRDRPVRPHGPQIRNGREIEVDPDAWRDLAVQVLHQIRQAEADSKRIHLVLGTVSLWNFLLGTLLVNRFGIELYHFQQEYHPLGRSDRQAKNLRSPAQQPPVFEWVHVEWIPESAVANSPLSNPPAGPGSVGTREALVLSIGANDIAEKVRSFLVQSRQPMPLRVVTKRTPKLDPRVPDQWIRMAAELAKLICGSSAADIYMFGDLPAVLALMVGDAIGSYCNSRIHLMQWNKVTLTYVEVLILPDQRLIELSG